MTLLSILINPPIKAILSTFLKVDSSEVASIPMEGPLIIATNHINSLDAPVGFSHLHPRPLTAFVKTETWDNLLNSFLQRGTPSPLSAERLTLPPSAWQRKPSRRKKLLSLPLKEPAQNMGA